ncbi:hypothetical protein EYF80_049015 [Liparis tanakae]|uniref:Uncharacterized protein n=1 Tax=Liparis tanakae TaxID=230148 RepID=A0A4Z2FJ70_9TELE|nr:hypothetical protein EYF80_049015 [Liparis tanakae]
MIGLLLHVRVQLGSRAVKRTSSTQTTSRQQAVIQSSTLTTSRVLPRFPNDETRPSPHTPGGLWSVNDTSKPSGGHDEANVREELRTHFTPFNNTTRELLQHATRRHAVTVPSHLTVTARGRWRADSRTPPEEPNVPWFDSFVITAVLSSCSEAMVRAASFKVQPEVPRDTPGSWFETSAWSFLVIPSPMADFIRRDSEGNTLMGG